MDIDEAKVEMLRAGGTLPMHEPGLPELVERNRERLTFTTEIDPLLDACRLLFCCVDTPPTYSGDADLSRVEAVVEQIPEGGEHALVMKSTVPAGTGAAIRRARPDLAYVSCPEFLKEGSAVNDFLEPDRVVIGADPDTEWAADAVAEAYAPLGGQLVRTEVASAEMIKLASNAFLATKISFINEIANVCEEVGADVTEVAARHGPRRAHRPEVPQGGNRLGRQLLRQGHDRAQEARREHRLSLPAPERGDRRQRVAEAPRGRQAQAPPRGARGAPDRAPGPRLQAAHRRHARRVEPRARRAPAGRGRRGPSLRPDRRSSGRGSCCPRSRSANRRPPPSSGADAAILVTEWPEFAELDWEEMAQRMANPLLVDGRNFLDPGRLRAAGFTYEGIGRPVTSEAPVAAD